MIIIPFEIEDLQSHFRILSLAGMSVVEERLPLGGQADHGILGVAEVRATVAADAGVGVIAQEGFHPIQIEGAVRGKLGVEHLPALHGHGLGVGLAAVGLAQRRELI